MREEATVLWCECREASRGVGVVWNDSRREYVHAIDSRRGDTHVIHMADMMADMSA